ncbi:DUF3077 domain-containing protein [Pseudomonas rhodesiae]|uniref:DUF3077 domain-containing protein n=1 Tax=Pseudomonas rhodesiae TaxID=76760 RepID=UPI001F429594|nr:DUF3077 domain-containing protein [Pseudomonas rhodesiae]
MKNNRHEKAPSAPTLEAYEAVNISEDIHMTKHTEVNEKLNAGAFKGPVTVALSFARCNIEGQDLYGVRPGIPAVDALNQASCTLHSVKKALEDAGMEELIVTPGQAWLLHMAVASAKAAIDSVTEGLEEAR